MYDFKELFLLQTEFQKVLDFKVPDDNPDMVAHHLLGLITEAGEVAQADKRWKKNGRNSYYNKEEKLEEIADMFIFLMNICLFSEIDSEEILDSVYKKIVKNTFRVDSRY